MNFQFEKDNIKIMVTTTNDSSAPSAPPAQSSGSGYVVGLGSGPSSAQGVIPTSQLLTATKPQESQLVVGGGLPPQTLIGISPKAKSAVLLSRGNAGSRVASSVSHASQLVPPVPVQTSSVPAVRSGATSVSHASQRVPVQASSVPAVRSGATSVSHASQRVPVQTSSVSPVRSGATSVSHASQRVSPVGTGSSLASVIGNLVLARAGIATNNALTVPQRSPQPPQSSFHTAISPNDSVSNVGEPSK